MFYKNLRHTRRYKQGNHCQMMRYISHRFEELYQSRLSLEMLVSVIDVAPASSNYLYHEVKKYKMSNDEDGSETTREKLEVSVFMQSITAELLAMLELAVAGFLLYYIIES